jgi:hypothetical protein
MQQENLELVKKDKENLEKDETIYEYSPTAKLRFVPKNNSLRPIMTFYKKFRDPETNQFV